MGLSFYFGFVFNLLLFYCAVYEIQLRKVNAPSMEARSIFLYEQLNDKRFKWGLYKYVSFFIIIFFLLLLAVLSTTVCSEQTNIQNVHMIGMYQPTLSYHNVLIIVTELFVVVAVTVDVAVNAKLLLSSPSSSSMLALTEPAKRSLAIKHI